MLEVILRIIRMVFTQYLVGLLIICGVVLSLIFPAIIEDSKFPVEYKLGKYAGYAYMSLGVLMFIIVMLLG